jgi:hypothetical protein
MIPDSRRSDINYMFLFNSVIILSAKLTYLETVKFDADTNWVSCIKLGPYKIQTKYKDWQMMWLCIPVLGFKCHRFLAVCMTV